MKTVFAILTLTILTGCSKPAETSTAVGREFVVDKLFTHEGCTVYRFEDSGYKRYFTNCNGSVNWQESCGKHCTRPVGVD